MRKTPKSFHITADHLKLMRSMFVKWWRAHGVGAPAIDPKRPYGSGDIFESIAEILEWKLFKDHNGELHMSEEQYKKAEQLHEEMKTVLQIVFVNCTMAVGTYVMTEEYDNLSWRPE